MVAALTQPFRGLREREYVGILALALFCGALTVAVEDRFLQHLLVLFLLWSVAAQAWNLCYGYAGLLSFGHSAFLGLGAYAFVFLLARYGITPYLGIVAAMVLAVVVAIVIGAPTFRLTGAYFTLATLVLPLILIVLFDYAGQTEVTVPFPKGRPELFMEFRDPRLYSLLALAMLVAVLLLMRAIDRGRSGYSMRALRANETAASAIGVHTSLWKFFAFTVSAAMVAAMGVVYVKAALLVVSTQDVFGLGLVFQMLAICLVGGLGARWGPVLGAALLIPLAEVLNANFGGRIPGVQLIAYGVILVLVILLAPEGLYWRLRAPVLHRLRRDRPPTPVVTAPSAQAQSLVRRGSMDPVLEVSGLTVAFGGVTALSDVSLAVRRGEVVGVIGPNGAGKTTLLNLVNGFYPADSGRVRFEGRDVTREATFRRCRAGMARTFQTPQILPRFTARENALVAAFNGTSDVGEARQIAEAALGEVGVGDPDRQVSALSTLEIKLLELARALATGPSLLLVDELMGGLSAREQDRVSRVLRRLKESGLTLVLIEHSVASLVRLAERLVVLDQGSLIADGPNEEVIRDRRVIEAYLGSRWAAAAARQEPVG